MTSTERPFRVVFADDERLGTKMERGDGELKAKRKMEGDYKCPGGISTELEGDAIRSQFIHINDNEPLKTPIRYMQSLDSCSTLFNVRLRAEAIADHNTERYSAR